MKSHLAAAALLLSLTPATVQAGPPSTGSGPAWDILEGLTTEIGPRLAGSPEEAKARDWAVKKLRALGFQNVRSEPFTIQGWVRGAETARLTAPYSQNIAITALGYSAPTPAGGLTAELV